MVCPTCGAPPIREGDQRALEEEVRSQDLEPYMTLRYIARLFKVLAVLMVVMLVVEIVTGLIDGRRGVAAGADRRDHADCSCWRD